MQKALREAGNQLRETHERNERQLQVVSWRRGCSGSLLVLVDVVYTGLVFFRYYYKFVILSVVVTSSCDQKWPWLAFFCVTAARVRMLLWAYIITWRSCRGTYGRFSYFGWYLYRGTVLLVISRVMICFEPHLLGLFLEKSLKCVV